MTPAAPAAAPTWTARGSAAYRRVVLALFLAGLATFSLLYCVQPLLPVLAADFRLTAAESSLAVSFTTGLLAVSIMAAGALSHGVGRRGLMFGSLCAAAVLDIVVALAPSWPLLLAARALEGVALGGVPAVAMAYLAEEIEPRGLGFAMGLYVGGTAVGGMLGRVGAGVLTEFASWRVAVGVVGLTCLALAIGFRLLLPASRNVRPHTGFDANVHLGAWARHLRSPGLPWLFAIGFLGMGVFITVYNYAGFRLAAPPYDLGHGAIGAIFSVFLLGTLASSAAGALTDRLGRPRVLAASLATLAAGVGLTLVQPLAGIVFGIALLTIGFFAAHSVASGWVAWLAEGDKGHATSLYLLAYYLGSSVVGSAGGWFWGVGGWPAVSGFAGVLLAAAMFAAWRLVASVRRAETRLRGCETSSAPGNAG